MGVKSGYRGGGVGLFLLQLVCEAYRYAGYGRPKVLLASKVDGDKGATKWYENKLGFERLEWRDQPEFIQKHAQLVRHMAEGDGKRSRNEEEAKKKREKLEEEEEGKPFLKRDFIVRLKK